MADSMFVADRGGSLESRRLGSVNRTIQIFRRIWCPKRGWAGDPDRLWPIAHQGRPDQSDHAVGNACSESTCRRRPLPSGTAPVKATSDRDRTPRAWSSATVQAIGDLARSPEVAPEPSGGDLVRLIFSTKCSPVVRVDSCRATSRCGPSEALQYKNQKKANNDHSRPHANSQGGIATFSPISKQDSFRSWFR